MNHAVVTEHLADYLEGDLALDLRALVDAHLDSCELCSSEVREMQQTIRLLRALPEPPQLALIDLGLPPAPHLPKDVIAKMLAENVDGQDQHPPRPYFDLDHGSLKLENYPVRPSRGWNLTSWLKTHSRLFNRLHFAIARTKLRLTAWRRGETPNDAPPGQAGQPLPHTDVTEPLKPLQQAALTECYRRMHDDCQKAGVEFRVDGGSTI